MKKILLILISIVLFSCASAPEQPVEEPVKEEVKEAMSVTELRNKAYSAMEKALSIKADVAVKEDYAAADKMFKDAEALDASDPESACKGCINLYGCRNCF